MDLPHSIDDAIELAAWVEAIGPGLYGMVTAAAVHDAVTSAGQFPDVMEIVLPIARALTIMTARLHDAEEHIGELREHIQHMQAGIRQMAAKELAAASPQPERVTGVAWTGPADNFFTNMPAINQELAKGIVEMVKRDAKSAEDSAISHPNAIETTESDPNRPEIGPQQQGEAQ